uniref:Uncharacterized protein LOC110217105 n=1 Tax=Phascolarctos cinereus TaxID=38626 RepID=A0A6P5L9K9_PHACI|nr:uncharacterized protein LOC110217105 [Phascolarctos cinereus]
MAAECGSVALGLERAVAPEPVDRGLWTWDSTGGRGRQDCKDRTRGLETVEGEGLVMLHPGAALLPALESSRPGATAPLSGRAPRPIPSAPWNFPNRRGLGRGRGRRRYKGPRDWGDRDGGVRPVARVRRGPARDAFGEGRGASPYASPPFPLPRPSWLPGRTGGETSLPVPRGASAAPGPGSFQTTKTLHGPGFISFFMASQRSSSKPSSDQNLGLSGWCLNVEITHWMESGIEFDPGSNMYWVTLPDAPS